MKEEVRKYLEDEGYILVFWHKDDVINQLENSDFFYTEDDVNDVMSDLECNHDANYGINWEIIDARIWELYYNRPLYHKDKVIENASNFGFVISEYDSEKLVEYIIENLNNRELTEDVFKGLVKNYLKE